MCFFFSNALYLRNFPPLDMFFKCIAGIRACQSVKSCDECTISYNSKGTGERFLRQTNLDFAKMEMNNNEWDFWLFACDDSPKFEMINIKRDFWTMTPSDIAKLEISNIKRDFSIVTCSVLHTLLSKILIQGNLI
jgi:hypothetical protein